MKRHLPDYARLTACGFAMGASDIVPGVSGGTIALLLGIYEELIHSIKAVGHREFRTALLKGKILDAWNEVNGNFLVAVGLGVGLAVLSLSQLLSYLIEKHPVQLWSFFFGLVIASAWVVSKVISKWTIPLFFLCIASAVGAYHMVHMVPMQTPETWWFLMLAGSIVICAMILPGVSGSFLLVLLGKYKFILDAVNNRDIVSLAIFMVGAAVGIVLFAQLLSWLLKKFRPQTIAVLTGLMIGSLRKIWPWKEGVADGHAVLDNVLPPLTETGSLSPEAVGAFALMLVGFGIVSMVGNKKEM